MIITCIVIFALLFIDQLTKYLAEINIALNSTVTCIPNFLSFTKIYNTGAAWGMLDNNTLVLAIISLVAAIVLLYYCTKCDWKKKKFYSIYITLLFTGCVGNMFDRFASVIPGLKEGRPGVVDMIVFGPLDWIANLLTGKNFPVFNMADAYLVIGVIMFAIYVLFIEPKEHKNDSKNK